MFIKNGAPHIFLRRAELLDVDVDVDVDIDVDVDFVSLRQHASIGWWVGDKESEGVIKIILK